MTGPDGSPTVQLSGRVAYVGIHDPAYPRNARIRAALESAGLSVTRSGKSRNRGVRNAVAELRSAWTSSRGTRVIVVSEFGLKLVPGAWLVSRLRRIPLIVDGFVGLAETHIDDWATTRRSSVKGTAYRLVDALAATLADAFLIDTRVRADAVIARYPRRNTGNTFAIPVGAPAWARPVERPVQDGPLRVLYYGNYIPLHGLPLIVEAVGMANRRRPIQLTLIGAGEGRPPIEAAVEEAGLDAITTFLDPVPEAALRAQIGANDVVLGVFGGSAKARSVLANKVWQGLACGRAVVTQDSPALDELRPLVGGQLIATEPGVAMSLASALESFDATRCFADRAGALEEYARSQTMHVLNWLRSAAPSATRRRRR